MSRAEVPAPAPVEHESKPGPEHDDGDPPIWLRREARYGLAAVLSVVVLVSIMIFNKGRGTRDRAVKNPVVAQIATSAVTHPTAPVPTTPPRPDTLPADAVAAKNNNVKVGTGDPLQLVAMADNGAKAPDDASARTEPVEPTPENKANDAEKDKTQDVPTPVPAPAPTVDPGGASSEANPPLPTPAPVDPTAMPAEPSELALPQPAPVVDKANPAPEPKTPAPAPAVVPDETPKPQPEPVAPAPVEPQPKPEPPAESPAPTPAPVTPEPAPELKPAEAPLAQIPAELQGPTDPRATTPAPMPTPAAAPETKAPVLPDPPVVTPEPGPVPVEEPAPTPELAPTPAPAPTPEPAPTPVEAKPSAEISKAPAPAAEPANPPTPAPTHEPGPTPSPTGLPTLAPAPAPAPEPAHPLTPTASKTETPTPAGPDEWVALPTVAKGQSLDDQSEPSTPKASASASIDRASTSSAATNPAPSARSNEEPDDDGQVEPVPHVVQRGENFWTISRLYYGSGRFWKALWAANRSIVPAPEKLYVNQTIRIPPPESLDRSLIEPDRSSRPTRESASSASTSVHRVSRPAAFEGDDAGTQASAGGEIELPTSDPFSDEDRDGSEPATAPPAKARRPSYRVRADETVRTIARDVLGDSRRANEILELNPGVINDPYHLIPGQLLELPEDADIDRR